ncbi:MAG: sigma-54-dependent transcriptional regulator [Pseudomonadota bacterium]
MSQGRILLVDDDPDFLKLLATRLEREGFQVTRVSSGEKALAAIGGEMPDVVLTDLRMTEMDGIELLDRLQHEHPALPVLILTAHGTIPEAVEATQRGAVGFITKPIDRDDLLRKLEGALKAYGAGHDTETDGERWRTRSHRMQTLLAEARAAAHSDASVLIRGETGTGKEMLARYIHDHSRRHDGPWITVNCTAIPEHLLESELFGHVKGAFTGATGSTTGLIRAAHGGTLFLDEIGDMPTGLQSKLLRVLEERRVRPVGATTEHAVDLRVVSATHRDLQRAIDEGAFRPDLYYRLDVVELSLPPLTERREDIPLLVQAFLDQLCGAGDRKVYAPEAMELLVAADWPGNVRQLRNVVERNVALSPSVVVSREQVRDALGSTAARYPSFDQARDSFTRDYLTQLLKITDGNVSRAAKLARRNRTDFHKLMKRHGIERDDVEG